MLHERLLDHLALLNGPTSPPPPCWSVVCFETRHMCVCLRVFVCAGMMRCSFMTGTTQATPPAQATSRSWSGRAAVRWGVPCRPAAAASPTPRSQKACWSSAATRPLAMSWVQHSLSATCCLQQPHRHKAAPLRRRCHPPRIRLLQRCQEGMIL